MATLRVGLGLVPFFLGPDIVNHVAKVVIRFLVVGMCVGEVVLWELEDDGNENEELPDHLVPQIPVE